MELLLELEVPGINWGIVKLVILSTPKICPTTLMMKNARKAITRPITAATICFCAVSTLVLSPLEAIHLMPPKIRKKTDPRTATISKRVMDEDIKVGILSDVKLQRPLKLSLSEGHVLTSTA